MIHYSDTPSTFSVSSRSSSISSASSSVTCMRVFLIQTAKGLFSSSGGYKSNLCLLRHLASRGHSVRQLCYSHRGEVDAYVRTATRNGSGYHPQLQKRQLHLRTGYGESGIDLAVEDVVMQDGVQFVALEKEAFDEAFGGADNILKAMPRETANYIEKGILSPRLEDFVSFLQQEITNFSPTHIIFNDGLSMQATLALVMPNLNARRIAIIHTAEQLPFGPFAGGMPGQLSSPCEAKLLQGLDGIWSVSEAIRRYALEHGKLKTDFFVHHPWTYLEEQKHEVPVRLHNWDKKFIGMINPCPVKGAHILVKLAQLCPQHDFLVYKSWGFDNKCAQQMKALKNITIRPTCTDMEEAWRNIKVLLVPSLWFEAWGIVTIEAHLRGIPVISSNSGALPEAMLGLDYIIPVNPIRGERDENGAYIVPEQDVTPWVKVVNRLMSDKAEYERLSDKVRSTTEQWLKSMDETALEKWLASLSYRADNV
ncbi:glycosyltransferase family 4 [Pyrenophora seminiperda CCB06]|uniref:Glycosyltransferase family 4 n=1 Tax=Pyrenophora seminiperda CCB06 TaxID=1302712 RepID=A0A3M7MGH1_9PLEO|nr:glycosyltransferase family 4 [Pyrenophora seminiperda CCB06]